MQGQHRPQRAVLDQDQSPGRALTPLGGTRHLELRTYPATPLDSAGHADACLLQRVGTQFVRCDDLTGNGVTAPAYLPER